MVAVVARMLGIVVVGIFVAGWWSYGLLNPLFFTGFGGVSFLLAVPATLASSGRHMGIAVAKACGTTGLILVIALVCMNRGSPMAQVLLPEPMTIFDAALFCIAMAFAGTSVAAWLSQRFPPGRVRWGMRLVMIAGLLAFRQMPVRWTYAAMDAIPAWGLTRAVLVLTAGLALFTLVFLRLSRNRVATMQA